MIALPNAAKSSPNSSKLLVPNPKILWIPDNTFASEIASIVLPNACAAAAVDSSTDLIPVINGAAAAINIDNCIPKSDKV